jgi:hypothetical protein
MPELEPHCLPDPDDLRFSRIHVGGHITDGTGICEHVSDHVLRRVDFRRRDALARKKSRPTTLLGLSGWTITLKRGSSAVDMRVNPSTAVTMKVRRNIRKSPSS